MPELPEVETIRRDLAKYVIGKKITKVWVGKKRIVRNPLSAFGKTLTGNKIKKLERRGKLLIAELGRGGWLLLHLKMTGQLIYRHGQKVVSGGHPLPFTDSHLPNKYTHVIFEFADKGKLFFNDLRQFGYMKLVDEEGLGKVLKDYGLEPLSRDFTLAAFTAILKGKKAPVKAVLMNQNLIAGIGNIYADEACFAARILPRRRAHSLAAAEIKRLRRAIRAIIKKAVAKRGTTFRDYRDPDGKHGNFVKYLKVYGRGGEKCLRCGQGLHKARVAGRGTVFCINCQK